jgi:Putative adhesin
MKLRAQLVRRFRWPIATLGAVLLIALVLPVSAHRLEKHFTVKGHPVITVRNAQGRIEVKSWQRPEVVVVGNHASSKVETDTEQAGDRIEVLTHVLSEKVSPSDLQADYTITVPEESELRVTTDSGTIVVNHVFGDMTFDTVSSDVQLQEVAGYLAVKTIGGSVECTRCAGRMDVNSISGNVRLLEPQLNSVRVQTSSGNIFFDGKFLPQGIYILKNYSGLIEVRFADTDSFDLSANSLYGHVENQANVKPDTHGLRRPPARFAKGLFGTVNEGQAKVELSSFNGTIKILKRE